ncbi:unnamed protein product [Urochloa humidicola]
MARVHGDGPGATGAPSRGRGCGSGWTRRHRDRALQAGPGHGCSGGGPSMDTAAEMLRAPDTPAHGRSPDSRFDALEVFAVKAAAPGPVDAALACCATPFGASPHPLAPEGGAHTRALIL